MSAVSVRRIATQDSIYRTANPTPGTSGHVEMDSNADTCCLGQNFLILHHTQRVAEVFAYDATLPSKHIPIVSGATAFTNPKDDQTYILIINEGLYYGNNLDHSLFNPNQIRMHGHSVWDNPFDH